ncbi:TadE/TadG family type IV pilus assembly protein [Cognatishimia sp. F0-27]|uniref:TadE/TadG family type IV pilus assembly protein n=1 Tax=Cognatishimia sp. F0-27 TaxID=2816855 RepID=UPI001D0C3667|nr:TadE/TadG family type IV pilus assembly protein [Cognatishimia sp. F0-27]MCC1491720.1 hypothetical protein [Cognatishimia sp. F0-27]
MTRAWYERTIADEDGNITIFSVFMTVLILMITGAAVDIMRHEATRAKLQGTMDRAVLAAADLDQMQDPETVVRDYMAKSGLEEVLANVSVNGGFNERTVSADGSADMSTIFLHMSGFDTLTAPAASAAEERISNVEISLVLDISGSMRYNQRMDRLRPAAQDFVDKVMDETSVGVTTLNLVPYAGHVNPGTELFEYFRGERPKIKKPQQGQNNGWGNGDQDAPGGSLCNNNAENAEEGANAEECGGDGTVASGVSPSGADYFDAWGAPINNVVFYFDTDGDDIYNRAHMIRRVPNSAPRDLDAWMAGAVNYIMSKDHRLTDHSQFLGASIKGGGDNRYYQVKTNQNGPMSDLGPTKNSGKLPGGKYDYDGIDFDAWAAGWQDPNPEPMTEAPTGTNGEETDTNVNIPGSCVEIYDNEFSTTAMPLSSDYVPHFHHWAIDREVMDWGWCPGEDTAIQYFSANKQALKDFIGDMRMHDGTGTQYGMKYGLALLDPINRDEVMHLIEAGLIEPRFAGRPIDWHDNETEKYIVLMTDGQTTDQYRPNDPEAAINGEVELKNQDGNVYHNWSNKSTNVSNLQQQCALARSLGVTVFTVAFDTNSAATEDMRQCASSDAHFFHVQGDEIYEAFDTIARQINNLRLIQ